MASKVRIWVSREREHSSMVSQAAIGIAKQRPADGAYAIHSRAA